MYIDHTHRHTHTCRTNSGPEHSTLLESHLLSNLALLSLSLPPSHFPSLLPLPQFPPSLPVPASSLPQSRCCPDFSKVNAKVYLLCNVSSIHQSVISLLLHKHFYLFIASRTIFSKKKTAILNTSFFFSMESFLHGKYVYIAGGNKPTPCPPLAHPSPTPRPSFTRAHKKSEA